MPKQSLEEKFKALERKLKSYKSLEKEIKRLKAIHEIQNLVGKYEVVHTPKSMAQTPELFALKQPDVSVEIAMWGVFVGAESIKKMYSHMEEGGTTPGMMFEHQLTTPIIEVADDLKTAKGLWFSPGHETHAGPDGKLQAKWCWGKFGADFIKEDGKWKIWHYHWYDTFMVPYEKNWVDTPQPALDVIEEHEGFKSDKPPTSRSTYYPDVVRGPIPWYPEPYKTWDGKTMC